MMNDLVGTYTRLEYLYRMYIKSAFPLQDQTLSVERDRLLQSGQPPILSQPPVLETVPVYDSSNMNLDATADRLTEEVSPTYSDVRYLAQRLFPPERTLYRHQWNSIYQALQGNDLVVTTGTGSGKTECFLLPLLAQLAAESATWAPSGSPAPHRDWWNHNGDRVGQWSHIRRPSAIRALILYPLNALVEDQLRRLRSTLDNPDVHTWLDQNRGGNRITFGRYTSLTPTPGSETSSNISRLRRDLEELDKEYRETIASIAQNPAKEDLQWYFANPQGGEMWSRWDMQETPPDILITNYSMLNIMMMRNIESRIFQATREWLAEPDHPERVFHLIVDELHSYRGTPGTEVAYVIRLLLYRLGLEPGSPKLRILTTTASLEDTDEGHEYLQQFFGRSSENFKFISGTEVTPEPGSFTLLRPHMNAFSEFASEVLSEEDAAISTLSNRLGYAGKVSQTHYERLASALQQVRAVDALRDATIALDQQRGGAGIVRPALIPDIDAVLFPDAEKQPGQICSAATHGLLLALALSKDQQSGSSVQPVRGHLFFHNLQNLWVCTNPECTMVSRTDPRPSIGALHATNRLACECGSRVLDLIVCEVCGEVFLGGYKRQVLVGQKTYVLTPDQPDLEGLPDRSNSQRVYGNYGLFWPLKWDEQPWDTAPIKLQWTRDGIKYEWSKATLDPATGTLMVKKKLDRADEVPGWVYTVKTSPNEHLQAMPMRCPRCDADHGYKDNFPTPLRNHRTGFQKACQVLAGGILREMPNTETKQGSSRKLVLFSDSRQDAAKLAAGMERDHYRDLVRMALIKALNEYWDDLIGFLRASAQTGYLSQDLKVLNSDLYASVTSAADPQDGVHRNQFYVRNRDLIPEIQAWLMGQPSLDQARRDEWLRFINDYPHRISLGRLRNTIADILLNLGVNFAGSSYSAMHFGQRQDRHEWFECFNWNNNPVTIVSPSSSDIINHITLMNDDLMGELMYALFPHKARTLEGLGQGWVSYRPNGNVAKDIIHATEVAIRLMGIRRRHIYAKRHGPGADEDLPGFVRLYLMSAGVSARDVQDQLKQSGLGVSSWQGMVLDPANLYIVRPQEEQGFRCPRCNTFYLHPVPGICPECRQEPLEPSGTTQDFDYYVYLSEKAGSPFRMNAEELIGQTDRKARSRRQRWFQDIFIDSELEIVQGVDLLSVTTTMEAGVDIGALLAVMMANMPPRRFNYQQRVGRAGRRGAGLSLAVTFCRGRSHDDFYFLQPEKITGDPPPSPYVDVTSKPIFKRMLIKETLRQAFANNRLAGQSQSGDNVHGEFGLVTDWPTYQPLVQNWIQSPNGTVSVDGIIDSLAVQTIWNTDALFKAEMRQFIQEELVQRITAICLDNSFTQDALSERVANAGLLPMFGFPTRIRLLYTRWPNSAFPSWPPEEGTIDRDLDIAISQFAPNSETVKDKAVYTACGVVDFMPAGKVVVTKPGFLPPLPQDNQNPLGICSDCRALVLDPLPQPIPAGQQQETQTCPVCGHQSLHIVDAREPRGFFTNLQPTDYTGQFEWTPRSTKPSLSFSIAEDPIAISNATVNALPEEQIISINDNNGKGGFDFQEASIRGQRKEGAYLVDSDDYRNVAGAGSIYKVALLSKRLTDVLLVGIREWPQGVFADPLKNEGRAAWYSFAFWLRTAAAVLLDVDPQELQAGFRTIQNEGLPAGQAFLSDQLENGAGYSAFLSNLTTFQNLLDFANLNREDSIASKWLRDTHASECDASCNNCLRDFGNLAYHGLLDWRLALDMVRLATGEYNIDLTSPWGPYNNPWQSSLQSAIPLTLRRLGYNDPESFGNLRGYVHPRYHRVLIETHPLWQIDHPDYLAAQTDAFSRYNNITIGPMNPFTVLRRPGDYLGS